MQGGGIPVGGPGQGGIPQGGAGREGDNGESPRWGRGWDVTWGNPQGGGGAGR